MQLMDCATLATATLSAWRWKMSRVMPVSSASRMVDCCERLYCGASSVPLPYHAPHSSTTSLTAGGVALGLVGRWPSSDR